MWITNVSPTADAGSPVALISIPDASIATWPSGSRRTAKIADGSALMVRCTSMRSVVVVVSVSVGVSLIGAASHRSARGDES